jgi:hypothetical protein
MSKIEGYVEGGMSTNHNEINPSEFAAPRFSSLSRVKSREASVSNRRSEEICILCKRAGGDSIRCRGVLQLHSCISASHKKCLHQSIHGKKDRNDERGDNNISDNSSDNLDDFSSVSMTSWMCPLCKLVDHHVSPACNNAGSLVTSTCPFCSTSGIESFPVMLSHYALHELSTRIDPLSLSPSPSSRRLSRGNASELIQKQKGTRNGFSCFSLGNSIESVMHAFTTVPELTHQINELLACVEFKWPALLPLLDISHPFSQFVSQFNSSNNESTSSNTPASPTKLMPFSSPKNIDVYCSTVSVESENMEIESVFTPSIASESSKSLSRKRNRKTNEANSSQVKVPKAVPTSLVFPDDALSDGSTSSNNAKERTDGTSETSDKSDENKKAKRRPRNGNPKTKNSLANIPHVSSNTVKNTVINQNMVKIDNITKKIVKNTAPRKSRKDSLVLDSDSMDHYAAIETSLKNSYQLVKSGQQYSENCFSLVDPVSSSESFTEPSFIDSLHKDLFLFLEKQVEKEELKDATLPVKSDESELKYSSEDVTDELVLEPSVETNHQPSELFESENDCNIDAVNDAAELIPKMTMEDCVKQILLNRTNKTVSVADALHDNVLQASSCLSHSFSPCTNATSAHISAHSSGISNELVPTSFSNIPVLDSMLDEFAVHREELVRTYNVLPSNNKPEVSLDACMDLSSPASSRVVHPSDRGESNQFISSSLKSTHGVRSHSHVLPIHAKRSSLLLSVIPRIKEEEISDENSSMSLSANDDGKKSNEKDGLPNTSILSTEAHSAQVSQEGHNSGDYLSDFLRIIVPTLHATSASVSMSIGVMDVSASSSELPASVVAAASTAPIASSSSSSIIPDPLLAEALHLHITSFSSSSMEVEQSLFSSSSHDDDIDMNVDAYQGFTLLKKSDGIVSSSSASSDDEKSTVASDPINVDGLHGRIRVYSLDI